MLITEDVQTRLKLIDTEHSIVVACAIVRIYSVLLLTISKARQTVVLKETVFHRSRSVVYTFLDAGALCVHYTTNCIQFVNSIKRLSA